MRQLPGVIDRMVGEGNAPRKFCVGCEISFAPGRRASSRSRSRELLDAARRLRTAMGAAGDGLAHLAAAELPELLVDRLQIELVLRNLISNAVDATANQPAGVITVTAEREDARHVRLAVFDNGPGVAADVANGCSNPSRRTSPRLGPRACGQSRHR